jgi:hypothetical protein
MPTSVGAGMCGQGAAQDGGAGQGDADGGDGPRPTLSTPASIQHRPFLPTSTRCALRPVSSSLRRCGPKTKAPGVGLRYGSDPQTCPVRTLRAWLDAADIDEGPAFRHIDRQGRLFPDRIFGRAAAERVSEARSRARRGSDDQSGPCRNPRGRPCQRRTTGRSTLTDLRVRARGRRRLPRGIRCGRRSSRPPIPS